MKQKLAVKRIGPATEISAVREYFELGVEIERLELRRKALKEILERSLEKAPEHKAEIGGYFCQLSRFEREFFKLKDAQEALGRRILRPFTTTTEVTQLRITRKD